MPAVRRIRCFLPLVCLLAVLTAGASSASASEPEFTSSEARRALEAAQEALDGSPAATDATYALRNLALALPALERADRRRASGLLARPTDPDDRNYFGQEASGSPRCTENFCVHWTKKGKNAPANDAFVDEVAAAVEQSYAVENGTLGWREAKRDGRLGARGGEGDEGQVDVYITNLGAGLYGFAAPDGGQQGSRRHAYLVLDNNYLGFPGKPLDSMRVTAAHEYNHILQFNYDLFQDLWMFESTATWVEEYVFPEINDYLFYLKAFTRTPQTPLTGKDIEIYAEAVWNHWLSSRYTTDVVRDAWAVSRQVDPRSFAPAAYGASIRALGGPSFSEEFGEFAAATAEWRSAPESFPDAAVYPDMRRSGKLGAGNRRLTLDNTSYELFDVKPQGTASLVVRAPAGVSSTIALVARSGPVDAGIVTMDTAHLPKGGGGSVQLEGLEAFDRVTAVIINGDARRAAGGGYKSDDSKYRVELTG